MPDMRLGHPGGIKLTWMARARSCVQPNHFSAFAVVTGVGSVRLKAGEATLRLLCFSRGRARLEMSVAEPAVRAALLGLEGT